jgi:hypothetical protein
MRLFVIIAVSKLNLSESEALGSGQQSVAHDRTAVSVLRDTTSLQ